ncbi:MAG TPA: hypothetical protein VNO50_21265 [Pyrinomonadaceae bacterium]|nr:hypothetical protein [Pyrinomonadaceae bacterium]
MITGFNTDIERDGVVYHVQTEDKGLDTPLILSLVYSGGEILAAKRTPYKDLIAEGFSDQALAERLKRQHRLICAAINAGRIEELKQMSARREEGERQKTSPPEATAVTVESPPPLSPSAEEFVIETSSARPTSEWTPAVKTESESEPDPADRPTPPISDRQTPLEPIFSATKEQAYTVYDSRRASRPKKKDKTKAVEVLTLSILDDEEFVAGKSTNIRILLQRRVGDEEKPLSGVSLSIKVLGATFRPQIYAVKTQRDGVALVSIVLPTFSSGRAAVVIRAEAQGETAELRRVIHPAG